MSLFGNPQNTTQTGGGVFGSTTGQQQTGGGAFGTSSQPSLFGITQQPQPQQQSAPSLFGGTSGSSTSGGGSIFGSSTAGTTSGTGGRSAFGGGQQSLFGSTTGQQQQQQPASGGVFGSATQQQQQQQQPSTSGTSLFGSTTQQQQPSTGGGLLGNTTQQQPTTSGGIFGSSTQQQPATGSGIFGITPQQQQSATGGGLFGSTTQQQQPPAGGGSLFGSSITQQPSTGGIFGSTTQQQQPTTGTLFGSTTQQQPTIGGGLFGTSTAGGGSFGSKPASSLFGSTTGTGAGAGIFGQQQQQPRSDPFGSTASGSLFGGGTRLGASTLGASALGRTTSSAAQQQFDAQLQSQKLIQKILSTKEAWNPQSPQCRFQYNFYNLVDPSQVHLYGRPQNATNDAIWDKAVRENPDPSCLVPVIAIGLNDLRERVDAQTKQAEKHQTQVKDLKARMDTLNEQHTLSNLPRLLRAASQQTQIQQRLMRFIQHLHLLIPTLRSSSIRPEEEQLRGRLEEIEEEVKRSRLKPKLNELWALLGAINASRGGTKNANNTGEWAVVDEEGMTQIAQILAEQQMGLAHLTKILQKMVNDLDIIMGRSRRSSPPNGDESLSGSLNESKKLWSPRSTLRASGLSGR
ncbi:hypothetical protein AX15_005547 [Amanita polypyramis BW_CC]|nr:hypothetical protein AX15_005547 [Amanita polypyramis BW_CC]